MSLLQQKELFYNILVTGVRKLQSTYKPDIIASYNQQSFDIFATIFVALFISTVFEALNNSFLKVALQIALQNCFAKRIRLFSLTTFLGIIRLFIYTRLYRFINGYGLCSPMQPVTNAAIHTFARARKFLLRFSYKSQQFLRLGLSGARRASRQSPVAPRGPIT